MVELISDNISIKVVEKEGSVIVTRTTSEKYDYEEYLRSFTKIEGQLEQLKEQEKALKDITEKLDDKGNRAKVEELRKKEVEEMRDERSKLVVEQEDKETEEKN